MIPLIGCMVGAYIVTRTTAMVTQSDVNVPAKILAVLTAIFSVIGMLMLVLASADVSRSVAPLLK